MLYLDVGCVIKKYRKATVLLCTYCISVGSHQFHVCEKAGSRVGDFNEVLGIDLIRTTHLFLRSAGLAGAVGADGRCVYCETICGSCNQVGERTF